MKRIEHSKFCHKKFYHVVAVISFLSLTVFSSGVAEASKPKNLNAKQIGFRVVDQPAVVIDGQAQNAHSPVPAAATAAPSFSSEPAVEGFADKVPLSVALQQILPQGYGYTLGDGVNAGQLVSWRGGRPWNEVLQTMLSSTGLAYSVNGRSVAINSTGTAPTIVMGTAPMAPAPVVMQPPMMDQQPMMMQPAPVQQMQPIMQQPMMDQQAMMQPPPQPQPMMMQPAPPMPQQMMSQQVMPQQAAPQPMAPQAMMQAGAPQPLQIENPLLFTPQTWEARPGQSLRSLLQEWCSRVGAELSWSAEFDYPIMASVNVTGTFEEAVRTLLSGFEGAKPTPRGRLHYNPAAGQSILIVEANGNHYGD